MKGDDFFYLMGGVVHGRYIGVFLLFFSLRSFISWMGLRVEEIYGSLDFTGLHKLIL